jgi:hypothetical protein
MAVPSAHLLPMVNFNTDENVMQAGLAEWCGRRAAGQGINGFVDEWIFGQGGAAARRGFTIYDLDNLGGRGCGKIMATRPRSAAPQTTSKDQCI